MNKEGLERLKANTGIIAKWTDESTGFACLIWRNPSMLTLCGYVGVTKEHSYFEKNLDDRELCAIDVHGGLTFAGKLKDGDSSKHSSKHYWYFGFDCNHYYDLAPGMIDLIGKDYELLREPSSSYKDESFVRTEIEGLVSQLQIKS